MRIGDMVGTEQGDAGVVLEVYASREQIEATWTQEALAFYAGSDLWNGEWVRVLFAPNVEVCGDILRLVPIIAYVPVSALTVQR